MKKVRVNVLMMAGGVIDCSFEGIQFTGVMDETSVYAKCVYGNAPEYVQIPLADTIDATEDYNKLSEFFTRELRIPKKTKGVDKLEEYFNPNISEEIRSAIDEAVTAEEASYLDN